MRLAGLFKDPRVSIPTEFQLDCRRILYTRQFPPRAGLLIPIKHKLLGPQQNLIIQKSVIP